MDQEQLHFWEYRLTRLKTEAATGYFDCVPSPPRDFESALAQSRTRPNDDFMRRHLFRLMADWSPQEFEQRLRQAAIDDLFLQALYFEACLLLPPFDRLRSLFPTRRRERLAHTSPLPFIKAHLLADHHLHRRWIEQLRPNFFEHAPLPDIERVGLPSPVETRAVELAMAAPHPLASLAPSLGPLSTQRVVQNDPAQLTALALSRLAQAGIQVGREMRHEASLSPIALLRSWQLALSVACGRHHYRLEGEQIAYGRGLDVELARVACVMEIVERVSAYATIRAGQVMGYRRAYPLQQARLSELTQRGLAALDPNRLGLEAPYHDEPLFWIEGRTATRAGPQPIQVPAQAVFLFCNLDEPKLFSGLGSTGLGAGASLAEAQSKALLEVIERDSAAVMPYTPALCFDVETGDAQIVRLLNAYAELGIHLGFLDITGPLGLPCCKCFVQTDDGKIIAGTGAHLDARRALLSALTETPYPFPGGPPSRALAPAKVRVPLEALPNYDRGDAQENLLLVERLLLANGFEPIYVDLTRADLDLPVVRAIIPGMELLGDFEPFSRIHPRLFGQYLRYSRLG